MYRLTTLRHLRSHGLSVYNMLCGILHSAGFMNVLFSGAISHTDLKSTKTTPVLICDRRDVILPEAISYAA